MHRRPLNISQLLEKFRESLFRLAVKEPSEAEEERCILRSLLKQNDRGIKRKLLEQELRRDEYYRNLCQKPKLDLG
jgi:hypothetical protein